MLKFGFYDSNNNDRVYNAEDMGRLFDGIICDGVFGTIGDHFTVAPYTSNDYPMRVQVKPGRAWFNGTWTDLQKSNDSDVLYFDLRDGGSSSRWDWIVLVIDKRWTERKNTIQVFEGARPVSTSQTFYYPLAYVTISAHQTAISAADIQQMVGTNYTPFVTGPLETISIDGLIAQWEADIDDRIDAAIEDYFDDGTGIEFAKVPTDIGNGFGVCVTSDNNLNKTCVIPNFKLCHNGRVSIRFSYDVAANSTLNISSTGAYPIVTGVSTPIADGMIKGGTTATFIYDQGNGGKYCLTAIDKILPENMTFVHLSRNGSALTTDTNADVIRVVLQQNPDTLVLLEDPDGKQGIMTEAPLEIGDSMTFAVFDVTGTLFYTIADNGVVSMTEVETGSMEWGYAISSEAGDVTAKTASIPNYSLTNGGRVTIKFVNDIPANSSLNISGTGAKSIYYQGHPVYSGDISAGSLVTFIYDGTYQRYLVTSVDLTSLESITWNDIKPVNGVPKTDLSSDVQTSLGKADSAYQKPSGGIPWGDLSNELMTSIGKAESAYQKPLAGIPETDLDSSVQAKLNSGGSGSNVTFIDMLYYGGDYYPGTTSAAIYAALQNGNVDFILVDTDGRNCILVSPPDDATTGRAKFATIDSDGQTIIVYTFAAGSSTGACDKTTISVVQEPPTWNTIKPQGGIPATDMTAAVQAALAAAVPTVVTLTGSTPVITEAQDNTIYEAGELTSLTIQAVATGASFIVRFSSPGGTATVLTMPSGIEMPSGFTVGTYGRCEINVDGNYALAAFWPFDT